MKYTDDFLPRLKTWGAKLSEVYDAIHVKNSMVTVEKKNLANIENSIRAIKYFEPFPVSEDEIQTEEDFIRLVNKKLPD